VSCEHIGAPHEGPAAARARESDLPWPLETAKRAEKPACAKDEGTHSARMSRKPTRSKSNMHAALPSPAERRTPRETMPCGATPALSSAGRCPRRVR
jgi:hypothetical protein